MRWAEPASPALAPTPRAQPQTHSTTPGARRRPTAVLGRRQMGDWPSGVAPLALRPHGTKGRPAIGCEPHGQREESPAAGARRG